MRLVTAIIIRTGCSDHIIDLLRPISSQLQEGVAYMVVCADITREHELANAFDIYRSILRG